mmetsp:Transcript_34120/g.107560  ORF Transcript_34120/g.107560 Transcript_34120/m.107560 type:complete len:660 (-) Transcript_34120:231-2210(-)
MVRVDLHLGADVEVRGVEGAFADGAAHSPQVRAAHDARVAHRRLAHGDGVVLGVVHDDELAVAVLGQVRRQPRGESQDDAALFLDLLEVALRRRRPDGAAAGLQAVLLRAVAVVGRDVALDDDLVGRVVGVLDDLGDVQHLPVAHVVRAREVVGVHDLQRAPVEVDVGADAQVRPVVRLALAGAPADAERVRGGAEAVAGLGHLAAAHELGEAVAAVVRVVHLQHLDGVVREVVVQREALEVAVELMAVVPDAEEPQHLPVVLQERLQVRRLLRLAQLRLHEGAHGARRHPGALLRARAHARLVVWVRQRPRLRADVEPRLEEVAPRALVGVHDGEGLPVDGQLRADVEVGEAEVALRAVQGARRALVVAGGALPEDAAGLQRRREPRRRPAGAGAGAGDALDEEAAAVVLGGGVALVHLGDAVAPDEAALGHARVLLPRLVDLDGLIREVVVDVEAAHALRLQVALLDVLDAVGLEAQHLPVLRDEARDAAGARREGQVPLARASVRGLRADAVAPAEVSVARGVAAVAEARERAQVELCVHRLRRGQVQARRRAEVVRQRRRAADGAAVVVLPDLRRVARRRPPAARDGVDDDVVAVHGAQRLGLGRRPLRRAPDARQVGQQPLAAVAAEQRRPRRRHRPRGQRPRRRRQRVRGRRL